MIWLNSEFEALLKAQSEDEGATVTALKEPLILPSYKLDVIKNE